MTFALFNRTTFHAVPLHDDKKTQTYRVYAVQGYHAFYFQGGRLHFELITDEGMPGWSSFEDNNQHRSIDMRDVHDRYSQLEPIVAALKAGESEIKPIHEPVRIGSVQIFTVPVHGILEKQQLTYAVHDKASGNLVWLDNDTSIGGTMVNADGTPDWTSIGGDIDYDTLDEDNAAIVRETEDALRTYATKAAQ